MSDDEDKTDEAEIHAAARFADVEQEDGELRGPLAGLFPSGLAVPTLEEALAPLGESLPGFAWGSVNVKVALKKANKLKKRYSFLTLDEIPSIILYTMEAHPREDSLYFALNKVLRGKDRSGVKPWRDFIWLLLNSLKKLPASNTLNVVRGAKVSPAAMNLDLSAGDEFTWSGFSSVTSSVEVMESFLGPKGDRTMLQIQLIEKVGRDIKDFSLYPSEKELLLPPNLCFEFVANFHAGNGLVIIQATQTETVDPILDLGERCIKEVAGSGAKAAKTLKQPESGTEGKDVRCFLEAAGLASFANTFIDHGFDTMQLLSTLTDDDLKEYGLKLGHRRNFMSRMAGLGEREEKSPPNESTEEIKVCKEEVDPMVAVVDIPMAAAVEWLEVELREAEKKIVEQQTKLETVEDKNLRADIRLEVQKLEREKAALNRRLKAALVKARKSKKEKEHETEQDAIAKKEGEGSTELTAGVDIPMAAAVEWLEVELREAEKKIVEQQTKLETVEDKNLRADIRLEVQKLEREKTALNRRLKAALVKARKAQKNKEHETETE